MCWRQISDNHKHLQNMECFWFRFPPTLGCDILAPLCMNLAGGTTQPNLRILLSDCSACKLEYNLKSCLHLLLREVWRGPVLKMRRRSVEYRNMHNSYTMHLWSIDARGVSLLFLSLPQDYKGNRGSFDGSGVPSQSLRFSCDRTAKGWGKWASHKLFSGCPFIVPVVGRLEADF